VVVKGQCGLMWEESIIYALTRSVLSAGGIFHVLMNNQVLEQTKATSNKTPPVTRRVFLWYNFDMQKIATQVFICSSILFGIIGILIVITASGPDTPDSTLSEILIRLLFATVFVILPSFALSIAGKYLSNR
jgi:hypothetical protein